MPKRKALEADAVSITVRWALSGEILSAVSISHEASVEDLLSALPLGAHELQHLQVLFKEKTLSPQIRLGTVEGLLEYAEVAVVKRPPLLAILGCDGALALWKPEMGDSTKLTGGATTAVEPQGALSLSPSSDGSQLLVGYPQGVARLLSVEQAGHPADSHRCSAVFTARCGAVLSVSISPCGNYCITGYANCTARVWSVERGSCVKALCRHSGSVLAVSLSSDAETAVTGSSDELAKIWSVRTGSCSQVLRGHMGIVTSVSFAAEDQRVVTGSFDGSVKVWHCASGVCEMTLSTLSGSAPILSLAVCPVEDLVLTGSLDGRCRLWELSTGSMSQVFEAGEAVRSVAISRDGCHILCGDADGSCRFWNLKTRKSKQVYLQRGEPILSVMLHSLD
ncbi:unnamed protein product [Cladocopium goreaui]|uniref:Vegetative incompatibility protein HET-E-1 n=1 Tax=Cladocopium goreaui TaxID=2562237 RepID=A0A9P1FHQ5_9DINO|nr:unnamed protein product [Cladocopium goreaui]